jgi:hypothetical protein
MRPSDQLARTAWDSFLNSQYYETPSLYLGIRTARRALLANPEDGPTYFRLGQTYQRLHNLPHESNLATSAPLLAAIRNTQMVAAFQNSLRAQVLDAEKEAQAHEALFEMYYRRPPQGFGYIDAAVRHLREAVTKRTALGPQSPMSAAQHTKMIENMTSQLAQMDSELEHRLDRYNLNSVSKTGLEKVRVALQEGLGETALTALEEIEVDSLNNAEIAIVKQVSSVALDLGRLDKARQLLPDPDGEPIKPEDLHLYLRLTAARGDYDEADRILANALKGVWQLPPGQQLPGDLFFATAHTIGRVLQMGALEATRTLVLTVPFPAFGPDFWIRRWIHEAVLSGMSDIQQRAEWHLMRGWLALEAGRCVEARKHFQTVRDMCVIGDRWGRAIYQVNAWFDIQKELPNVKQVGIRHAVYYDLSVHYLNWLAEEQ